MSYGEKLLEGVEVEWPALPNILKTFFPRELNGNSVSKKFLRTAADGKITIPGTISYLNEKGLRALGQIVSGCLDFAERQAEREEAVGKKG